jgi:hypothetical protein
MTWLGIGLGWIEVMLEILRETPVFWTNAGGYPYWLRDVARDWFYPLLFLSVGNLAGLCWLVLRLPSRPWAELRRQLAWLLAIAALLALTVAIGLYDE